MSYIRLGTKLPSGKKSKAFVFGEKKGIINVGSMAENKSAFISYVELRQLFKTKTADELKAILIEKLDLELEEADYVCEGLFEEHQRGKWDEPFEFEGIEEVEV